MAWHAWAALLSWALAWTCVIAGSNRSGRGRIGRWRHGEMVYWQALFIAALALLPANALPAFPQRWLAMKRRPAYRPLPG